MPETVNAPQTELRVQDNVAGRDRPSGRHRPAQAEASDVRPKAEATAIKPASLPSGKPRKGYSVAQIALAELLKAGEWPTFKTSVEAVQEAVGAEVDGFYGTKTKAACKRYWQKVLDDRDWADWV